MKIFEEINNYKKEYVFDIYTRIIEDFKDYEKITKKQMIKKITILLAVSVLLSIFSTGCSNKKDLDNELEPDNASNGSDNNSEGEDTDEIPELPETVYTENDGIIVMNVGGEDISAAKLRYYILNYRDQYGGDDSSLWERAAVEEIKNTVAVEKLAEKYQVTLTDEVKKTNVDDIVAQTIDLYNNDESTSYQEELDRYYMTDALFRELQENMVLQSVMYTDCFTEGGERYTATDEDILEYIHDNYVRVKHILIKTADLDDEQKAEARARADKVLEEAKNGTSFEDLVTEYSEDGMDVDTGYYFTYGEMVSEFEDKSYELEIDEISDIVESPYGYHIIKRYAMDDNYILNNETLRAAAINEICLNEYVEELTTEASELAVEYKDNYEAVKADIIAEASASSETSDTAQ